MESNCVESVGESEHQAKQRSELSAARPLMQKLSGNNHIRDKCDIFDTLRKHGIKFDRFCWHETNIIVYPTSLNVHPKILTLKLLNRQQIQSPGLKVSPIFAIKRKATGEGIDEDTRLIKLDSNGVSIRIDEWTQLSGAGESQTIRSYHSPKQVLFLLLVIAICSKNALLSAGFDQPVRNHNNGFNHHNYPLQTRPPQNLNYHHLNGNFVFGESPQLVTLDSLTKDQDSSPPSSIAPTLGSWTSMLANTFNVKQDLLDAHIKKILVPRVSGTQGNIQVREYIVKTLRANNYHVDLDEFTTSTPIGSITFANIIAYSNPTACRQLVLACHYDSKMMDGFLGAIDSAVPCAMLLKMSETFKDSFRESSNVGGENVNSSLGLSFIFFDGEEAFVQWSPTDSLYGSRHLAAKWDKRPAPPECGNGKNELSRIELFILLDLIGTTDTSFVMYNRQLKHHYNALQKYERSHLSKSGLSSAQIGRELAFKGRHIPLDMIEDDHVPFKQRGVPILSLLAHPFPRVWHTIDDNYEAIDFARTRRIMHVLEEFVTNYSTRSD